MVYVHVHYLSGQRRRLDIGRLKHAHRVHDLTLHRAQSVVQIRKVAAHVVEAEVHELSVYELANCYFLQLGDINYAVRVI